MAIDALEAFKGTHVAYIGEMDGDGGHRTAGPRFHDALAAWEHVKSVPLDMRFPGVQDALHLWRRQGDSPDVVVPTEATAAHGLSAADMATADEERRSMVDATTRAWHLAAASHIAARRLGGGPGAAPGPEADAVRAAVHRSSGASLAARLAWRSLCGRGSVS
jgi:hypothetical protein